MTDQIKPPRKTGFSHLLAATQYSMMGFRRALRESAFLQELAGMAAGIFLLPLLGVDLPRILGFVILMLALMAVEAFNTALEEVVDHLSPDWSEFAKNAKDLGSFAVACLIACNLIYLGWALFL